MRYLHVIWDWNGTLFNDAWLCLDVMNGLLRRRNMEPLTAEKYQEIFDFPVIEYYRKVGFDFSRESFEVLGTEFIDDYERRRLEACLQNHALDVLKAIRGQGISQSVLSAYKQQTLDELLRHFGIRNMFINVLGQTDHYAIGKIEIGRAWIEELGVDPARVLLIGDTVHDHEVAEEIGCECWLIPAGNHSRDKLSTCGVPVLDSLADVLSAFTHQP
ncbi:MAG: HAD hydrolase-like protein [Verrucomicrobia bacterium]|nr:HAD hydrolase-like protein [Verrucomicrobiota bacterium]